MKKIFKDCIGLLPERLFLPELKKCMIKRDVYGNSNHELISNLTIRIANCDACPKSEALTDRENT